MCDNIDSKEPPAGTVTMATTGRRVATEWIPEVIAHVPPPR
jgi:hypothetical protein